MKNIKTILVVLLVAVLFTSCQQSGAGNDLSPKSTYTIIKIDSCEYIFISRRPWSADMSMAHKGNCSNPYHKDNQ